MLVMQFSTVTLWLLYIYKDSWQQKIRYYWHKKTKTENCFARILLDIFNCRMPAVQVSRVMCLFLAASSFISPLNAAGKCYRHVSFLPASISPSADYYKKGLIPFSHIQTNVQKWLIRNAYEKGDAHHLAWAEELIQLPLCQPVPHLVSLEKEGCPTCHLVETSICSGHCVTKVLWTAHSGPGCDHHVGGWRSGSFYHRMEISPWWMYSLLAGHRWRHCYFKILFQKCAWTRTCQSSRIRSLRSLSTRFIRTCAPTRTFTTRPMSCRDVRQEWSPRSPIRWL